MTNQDEEKVVLTVDRFNSRCGFCQHGADPYEEFHNTVLGYYAIGGEIPEPCGKRFTHIQTLYTDGTRTLDDRVHEMRPDLELISTYDIIHS